MCEIFHQRSFLKEGDYEIGTLILKRQIKIFGKLLGKVYYLVTSLISLTHCKVRSLRSWPDLIVCTRLMDSVVRCLINRKIIFFFLKGSQTLSSAMNHLPNLVVIC